MTDKPIVGVLCWEGGGTTPRGLDQLESLIGNSTNPKSYDFPVVFRRVPGANIHTILEKPDYEVMKSMAEYANRMVIEEGVRLIVTSCGFNAIFQKELSKRISVPVATSSLIQIPFISSMLNDSQQIAVITANKEHLTDIHFRNVGVTDMRNIIVFGMEECPEWNKIFVAPDEDIDLNKVREEVLNVATSALETYSSIGSFVLECTDLPPFANDIRKRTKLPIFDYFTMVRYLVSAIMNV